MDEKQATPEEMISHEDAMKLMQQMSKLTAWRKPWGGKHNVARAARAKARIAKRKSKR